MNPLPKINFNRGMQDETFYSISLFLLIIFIVIFFVVLTFRLFQLTIVKGEYYRRLSDENRIKKIVIEPKRGTLLDRRGQILAQSFDADLKGTKDRLISKRAYTEPQTIAHLLGYRQLADRQNIDNSPCLTKPRPNDKVGKKGAEQIYECQLKGTAGQLLVELDAKGNYMKTLGVVPPQEGTVLKLTIDLDLQKKAYQELSSRRGAVIGVRPKTGEILVFASSPSFNPQDFEDNNQDAVGQYFASSDKPLFNRITEGTYPPGSVIKPFIAAGALEDNKIDEKTTYLDEGKLKAGPLEFGNWYFLQYGKTEGDVDVIKAIRRSNDIFFYHVGSGLGPQRIKYWAQEFGFGKRTELPMDQAEGILPTPFWKEETIKDQWYLGDSYNLSIGQGYILVTPLQIANATAALASGEFCQPKLLKNETPQCRLLRISKKNLDLVREGMHQACQSGGTGWPFFDFKPEVGCKTGTAEAPGPSGNPHAWFTVFAPYENPEIVLTVLVEDAGQGSDIAAPIAREILKTYFERKE